MKINEAGSLEFTLPATNVAYEHIHVLSDTVDVVEAGEVIWTGRPVSVKKDFFNRQHVECEGALNFLKDIILTGGNYIDITPKGLFEQIIRNYGFFISHPGRMFTDDRCTISDDCPSDCKVIYESAHERLSDHLLERYGGYLILRKGQPGNNVISISYLKEIEETSSQEIVFGKNLLDISVTYDYSDVVTEIIPVCQDNDVTYTLDGFEEAANDDTIADYATEFVAGLNSSNHIRPVYHNGHVGIQFVDWASSIGVISKVVDCNIIGDIVDTSYFADWDNPTSEEQEEYDTEVLQNKINIAQTKASMYRQAINMFAGYSIGDPIVSVNVNDLKLLPDEEHTAIKLGSLVHVISEPHNVDVQLPMLEMDLYLDKGSITSTVITEGH
jgi:hypothetical protein